MQFKKLNLIILLTAFCLLLTVSSAFAAPAAPSQAQDPLFMEMWNRVAYYETNVERDRFSKILGRSEGRLGFNIMELPLQVYAVYYAVLSQDENYWNNSFFPGFGARIFPFKSFEATHWANEWLPGLRIYAESLSSSYLQNEDEAEAAGLRDNDTRLGLEIYHEWNLDNPDRGFPWAELWANYSYRSTNFTAGDDSSNVFFMQPRMGWHLGYGIGAYLAVDMTLSDNESYWLNIADYGLGIRFEPWREQSDANDLFRKFKMFAEVVGVSYLKDKPANPDNEVSSDVRFGIEFSYGR